MKIPTQFRGLAALLTTALLAACGSNDTEPGATLTRAQKDSIVADMPIPGASAVGTAMQARDQANARTEAHDTAR
jgi:16S rRNA C1402 (ribose-2'-O) methylase RsmI